MSKNLRVPIERLLQLTYKAGSSSRSRNTNHTTREVVVRSENETKSGTRKLFLKEAI